MSPLTSTSTPTFWLRAASIVATTLVHAAYNATLSSMVFALHDPMQNS